MLSMLVVIPLAHAEVPESPDEGDPADPSTEHPRHTPPGRHTRLGLVVGRAITGKVVDNNAFAEAELHGSNFLTLSAVFGCEMGCIGFVLPIEGVRATSTELTTNGQNETELKTTTLSPSLRLAYVLSPTGECGFGATGTFDIGYMFSVGGNLDVRGLALGIAGDVEYWLPPGVAVSLGLGVSGSPFSVLHYPTARVGAEYGF